MGSKAFESPLISHVRMRAMYRALVEVRALAERRKDRSLRGVEACWVGTSIDLKDGDLTSDGGGDAAAWLAHIRAAGERATAQALAGAELRATLKLLETGAGNGFPGDAEERLTCAIGAAMALQAANAQAVMVAYVGRAEISDHAWKRVLRLMEQPGLPLLVVVLPSKHADGDLEGAAKKSTVPLIPVDAGDTVGLYRVAQETLVRARAGGGAAVLEAMACGTDAVALLGRQLVRKGICTPRWVEAVGVQVAGMITKS